MELAEFDHKIMVCRCCPRCPSSTQRTGISNNIFKIEQHPDCCVGIWDAPTDDAPQETERLVTITGPILSTFGCNKSLSIDPFTCTIFRGTRRCNWSLRMFKKPWTFLQTIARPIFANIWPVDMSYNTSHLHQQVRIATFVMMKACVHVNLTEIGNKTWNVVAFCAALPQLKRLESQDWAAPCYIGMWDDPTDASCRDYVLIGLQHQTSIKFCSRGPKPILRPCNKQAVYEA